MPSLRLVPKRGRIFNEISRAEAFNLGRVVSVFESICVTRAIDGGVQIHLRGEYMGIDEALAYSRGLPNTL